MGHIFERYHHVVFSGHVVCQVMVHNKPEQFVQEGEVDLVIELLKLGLH